MPNRTPLFFYIFPRTSSTSLTKFLQSSFGDDEVFTFKVIEEFHEGQPINANTPSRSLVRLKELLVEEPIKKAYVVMAPFGVHEWVQARVDLFTTLREPVDRCLSLLNFMRAKAELNYINARIAGYGDNIDDIINCESVLCFSNEQTRMLSSSNRLKITEEDRNQAEANLRKFRQVFRFGDFEGVSDVVKKSGGRPINFPHLNSAPKETDRSQEEFVKAFADANEHDQALYVRYCL